MKVCERAGRSASLRPLPPLPAALESAWSLLSSASSAAASLWSLLSMLAVVITTTNAFIAIIIVTIILVAYHHQHLKLQIWRSVRSYQWNEHMLLVAMLMRGIILNFYCILDGMVSIHQLWLHRKRLKPSLKKAMKREAGEIFESYPGVIFQWSSTDWLTSFLFFRLKQISQRESLIRSQGNFCFNSVGRGKEEKMLEERLEAATMQQTWKKHRSEFVNLLR